MTENYSILIWISPKFVVWGSVDNESALVHVMAWCRSSNKQLLEPMMTQFIDAYIDGLLQDSSNSIANALELLQSCTKSSM